MIRYPISDADLLQRIREVSPTWLERARRATERHRAAGKYTTKSPDWGEIKSVFMRLQHDKCAYVGHWAVQKKKSGHLARMGKVTIDFFDLNHDSLLKSRADVVLKLYAAHQLRARAEPHHLDAMIADGACDVLLSESAAHASCARAFVELLTHAPDLAGQLAEQSLRLLRPPGR